MSRRDWRVEEENIPPLMIMRTMTHPAVRALGKNGGTGRGAATRATRDGHVTDGYLCDGCGVSDRRTKTPRRCRGGKLMR